MWKTSIFGQKLRYEIDKTHKKFHWVIWATKNIIPYFKKGRTNRNNNYNDDLDKNNNNNNNNKQY